VVTNTTPTVAYRGAGRPEAAAAIERAIDMFAAEIGMDPAEVRRRNFIGRDRFPFSTPTGAVYDIGDYEGALDKVLAAAGYEQLREEQERRRTANDVKQLGIGLSVYVEMTAIFGSEFSSVEIHDDGTVTVLTGTSPHGQGHETAWAMLVADRLGVPIESIRVLHGDTDVVPRGEGTMGSRSLQLGGSAVHGAAEAVVELAKERAGQQLEANPEDIVIDKERGVFHVAGTPSVSVSWAELAATSSLSAEFDFTATGGTYPFGAHVVVVEVDLETGRVEVVRLVAVDDAGRILNPLLADGQVHGGLAQGVAQALLEEFVYDADGNPLTTSFADYSVVSATELPSFEIVHMETPTPMNPLGAKGIGESGSVGATPAVQNAVVDALAHLGVRHVPMPATPERVWRVIQEAR
jgi:carbon-monoxide dehydrogenase large subunit